MLCAFVADRRRPVQPSPDIRALDSLGRDLIERAYADSTRRNLNSHIKIYLTFCEAVSFAPFPVTVQLITRYIAYLVSLGRVYGTILNHLSSIKHMHKFLGHDLTWDSDYRYKLLLRGVKRYLGTAVQRKAPITPRLLLRIVHLFAFDKPLHVAMWALFLVAFYSFLRKSNLVVDRAAQVSPKVLLRSALCFDASFAYLTVRASKTIQFQERLFSLPLSRIPGSLLCPVAALVNHLWIYQVPQDMPLFTVRSDSSLSHITYTHFSSFLARIVKAVGLDPTNYSPHRFRRGGATFAFEAKVPSASIKAQGDWRSDCYLIYPEMTDRQKRAAATRMAAAISHIAV